MRNTLSGIWIDALEARRLFAAGYVVTNLVSDGAVKANFTDPNLQNPWGIVFTDFGMRVADNGTGHSTAYNGSGKANGSVITIPHSATGSTPSNPTGVVRNTSSAFVYHNGANSGPAKYIFVNEDGNISAWNKDVSTNAKTVSDSSDENAVYKGDTIARSGGKWFLYTADFGNGRINVYDSNFQDATLAGHFHDPHLPSGYVPFNISEINGQLYVTYAKKAPGADDETDGPGLGLVDVYNNDGEFVRRLATGGALNAPWGMTIAPDSFGPLGGSLLVGNLGDGRISAFNVATGKFLGQLKRPDGHTVQIDDLWGIGFGTGAGGVRADRLYAAAGTNDEADGLIAEVRFSPSTTSTTTALATTSSTTSVFSTSSKIGDDLKSVLG
jgi:uncharacterized protein (TIGR03118 family)